MARIRMSLLYYYAGINGYLVAGTSDKSEFQIGYFSKFGDGAGDIMPIVGFVQDTGKSPCRISGYSCSNCSKEEEPLLLDNHMAEEEIGMNYEMIDPILHLLVDKNMELKDATRK